MMTDSKGKAPSLAIMIADRATKGAKKDDGEGEEDRYTSAAADILQAVKDDDADLLASVLRAIC